MANLFVALGVTEKESIGGSLYCSLLYFDNQGKLIGKHRKLKPTGLERYIWAESDGSTLVSFDTEVGKIGGLICWENYMPLARMAMYNQGVEIYPGIMAKLHAAHRIGRALLCHGSQSICSQIRLSRTVSG